MSQSKVLFIINPISGVIDKSGFPDTVKSVLAGSGLDVTCVYSERVGHAEELSRKAVADGYTMVFSVGGDGTMNEVARGLLNTTVGLGLVPLGSGNGLARHMGLPLKIKEAIALAKNHSLLRIDSGSINDKPFFNMAGVGFDAHIGHMFATSKERGFKAYVMYTITEGMNYKPEHYKLVNGRTQEKTAFLISFANSSQYG
ncbi:MAG: diacylglycerol kinase, partial [Cytophagales bacterium]|nr:diacylglycerol kinase [Cytophagales bacterium]